MTEETTDKQLETLFADLKKHKQEQVDPQITWYREHRTWPRIIFRAVGTTVILTSLIIPVIVNIEINNEKEITTVLSLLVAALTGLNAFYRWQELWESRSTTYKLLLHSQGRWEMELLKAKHEENVETAKSIATKATELLIEEVSGITQKETISFFKNISFPKTK
jgi:hypothetical protein